MLDWVFPAYRQLLVRMSGVSVLYVCTNHHQLDPPMIDEFLINPRIKHGPDTALYVFETGNSSIRLA